MSGSGLYRCERDGPQTLLVFPGAGRSLCKYCEAAPPLPLGHREQGFCGCVVCCLYHISRLSVSSAPSLGCMRQKYQHPENSLLCHSLGPQVRLSLPLHLLETPYFCFIYNVQGFSGRNRGSYSILSSSDQIRSVAQLCPTLCDPMNHSTPGLPVHHQLPEFTEIHVHRVSDAIQPSHPLSSPSPPAPNPSQHQSLFQ